MSNVIWSFALAAIGILGLWLAGQKNHWGWLIGLSAQGLWIVYAAVTGQWGFILSAIAYGIVYGRNFVRWRDEVEAAKAVEYAPRHWNGKIVD